MKRTFLYWQIDGIAFVSILGSVLHFLYGWSGQNQIVATFSSVNESTWEHMKILFFPLFFFAVTERCFVLKDSKNYWCVKIIGILSGVILIPVLFYTFNGVFGQTPAWMNIGIFFVAATVPFALETWLFRKDEIDCKLQKVALLWLIIISIAFVVFTFKTPEIHIFKDPLTGTFGLN